MGCNCGGATRRKEATGTRRAGSSGSTQSTPQSAGDKRGWYWTGPKRDKKTTA